MRATVSGGRLQRRGNERLPRAQQGGEDVGGVQLPLTSGAHDTGEDLLGPRAGPRPVAAAHFACHITCFVCPAYSAAIHVEHSSTASLCTKRQRWGGTGGEARCKGDVKSAINSGTYVQGESGSRPLR